MALLWSFANSGLSNTGDLSELSRLLCLKSTAFHERRQPPDCMLPSHPGHINFDKGLDQDALGHHYSSSGFCQTPLRKSWAACLILCLFNGPRKFP